ncbi:MAG: CDP-glucose 4,6-dehydratase [Immundisolibacter sp.]|uniref:CDP-glucose 4,6-dehydratase n=1 Tax=Immundisolibacter sp. TaxID=1934948 RepID=UPI003D125177
MDAAFWRGQRVLITGHTGFKGGWLSLWLARLGAQVYGYALPPSTNPSLYALAKVADAVESTFGDVRDAQTLTALVRRVQPEVVFHMAAQALVRASYTDPAGTYATNVMGTVNLLEAVRQVGGVRAVVVVTSDKCYENREWLWAYREGEPLGGVDPYSSSKACAELVAQSWRQSFFAPQRHAEHGTALASARAGNVIGGGDWAEDRLIPDILRAIAAGEPVAIRNPGAIRPWQHVLEPLSGYLLLAQRLVEEGPAHAEAWNFGPAETDARPVQWIVERLTKTWGEGASWQPDSAPQPHEAQCLKLDCAKANARLGWRPRWPLERALDTIVEWHRAHERRQDMQAVCQRQIDEYVGGAA